MEEFESYSDKSIRRIIAETESTLGELKAELKRREESAQRVQIQNLEEHMKEAEFSLKGIKNFISFLIRECRSQD